MHAHRYKGLAKKEGEVELSSLLSKAENGQAKEKPKDPEPPQLTLAELFTVLTPYFWPSSGSDGAVINRIRSSSTWLMVALSKIFSLSAPFYLSTATNALLANDFPTAATAMISYVALRFAASCCKELQGVLYIKVKQQASIQLQELVFSHIHSLSLNWHLSKQTGSTIKSMDRGVEAANSLISYLFLYLVPALLECMAVIVLFFSTYKQYQLGLFVFTGVALYIAVTVGITQYRKKYREETNKHDNDYHAKATDSILNYETVKYFTNEAFEVARFKESVVAFQKASSSTQVSLSALNVSQQLLLYATLLACMLLSGRSVARGQLTVGAWVAIQAWVAAIFVPLNFLGSIYNAIFQAFIDIRNLSQLLSQAPDVTDAPDAHPLRLPAPPAPRIGEASLTSLSPSSSTGVSVEFRDVSFSYPGQADRGLRDMSFLIQPGSTTAVVGHTGAGKTTLSRLLFRFFDPSAGAVLLHGQDLRQCTQQSVRQAIGIVPQDTVLFNDSILHNVAYGRLGATKEEIVAAAEAAQIRTFIENLPEGWDTVVGERGLKLSGGEKQRVAIARCLLKNPPVVVLDEATSALDTVTESSVQDALNALGKQRTVLIIAHRLSTIRQADQILVLDDGRVVEAGTHDQLLARPDGVYRHLWTMQMQSRV